MKLVDWLAVVPAVQNGWGFAALVFILLLWHLPTTQVTGVGAL
jgi:hypothetical protein